jgi:hypothetical protein
MKYLKIKTVWYDINMKKFKFFGHGSFMPDIFPSQKYLPEWYKNIKGRNINNIVINKDFVLKNIKNCMPVFDSFTTGYSVAMWTDMNFKWDEASNSHDFFWQDGPAPINAREKLENEPLPIPEGYSDIHYIWYCPYSIEVPKGYSILVTHPLNRFDLPFITMSGIVDDFMPTGFIPVFFKKGQSGTIEQGTPILQIIPFKRENWESEKDEEHKDKNEEFRANSLRTFFGYYRKNKWNKKDFK